MNWATYTLAGWLVLGLGISLAQHGESKKGKYSFWADLIGTAVIFALLYFGGWFA